MRLPYLKTHHSKLKTGITPNPSLLVTPQAWAQYAHVIIDAPLETTARFDLPAGFSLMEDLTNISWLFDGEFSAPHWVLKAMLLVLILLFVISMGLWLQWNEYEP